ncbi:hypothetical protein HRR83_005330 [Exophiala dermatitidis]|uniref:Uncharacterized protein n=1 Tax=Exophiala dermatitidis TaxID=5970 RepID=A0AAN6IY88_EXODE|nr:hypothetical protein HRR74_005183 [Exophiala dermatitidis]KAJ4518569.1 hypothetical protein HRR73_004150 [Exophiala dermatitidis]KAJ4534074.1 hypothetical protein HRR76_006015 [Exophiala dermatitidis]KAJ4550227.1 hypothetical protein HRR77_003701 [Exophiala dermatitidis]KAJ4571529.1 hypothetical protein HRR81_005560 [Exophiala dermatitidis]
MKRSISSTSTLAMLRFCCSRPSDARRFTEDGWRREGREVACIDEHINLVSHIMGTCVLAKKGRWCGAQLATLSMVPVVVSDFSTYTRRKMASNEDESFCYTQSLPHDGIALSLPRAVALTRDNTSLPTKASYINDRQAGGFLRPGNRVMCERGVLGMSSLLSSVCPSDPVLRRRPAFDDQVGDETEPRRRRGQ